MQTPAIDYVPNPADSPLAVKEEKTLLDEIQIRHTVCPICARYRQVNQATKRCHCADPGCDHRGPFLRPERGQTRLKALKSPCPLAACRRIEAKRAG